MHISWLCQSRGFHARALAVRGTRYQGVLSEQGMPGPRGCDVSCHPSAASWPVRPSMERHEDASVALIQQEPFCKTSGKAWGLWQVLV